jgi:dihydroorotase/N-acyl-D-amino-acid deacylase
MSLDLLVAGGSVYDGQGGAPRPADVGVRAGRIEAVGDLAAAEAAETIDATGLAVAPGFVDSHTHSDLAAFLGDEHDDVRAATIRQGVTTEICGNCGFSPFPYLPPRSEDVARLVAALFGPGEPWSDVAGYREAVRQAGLYANLGPLVGHGSLRAAVLGFDDRPPDAGELRELVRLADEAFEQGALGLSTGLIYMPGVYAETEELVALCRALARHGRPYTTHMRGESDTVVDSVREALRIGRESGMAVHVSHHKAAGRANWGRTHETLALVDEARREGLDVTLDVYPYTAGSTVLYALLPPWAQVGGVDAMVERLGDRRVRERIVDEMGRPAVGWENMARNAGWEGIYLSSVPGRPELEGRSLPELAAEAGTTPADFAFDVVVSQRGRATMILHQMDEGDVARVLAYEGAMVGSDGIPLPGKPHPRWAGTAARVLGRYAREQRLLSLPEAIRKLTSLPADRFGLSERGRIAAGKVADLVVFDPESVLDRATFDEPLLAPLGVPHVVVAGQVAVRDGALTGVKAGQVLSRA